MPYLNIHCNACGEYHEVSSVSSLACPTCYLTLKADYNALLDKIDWKFKEDALPQGSSNGFWYDITDGGYVEPEKVLSDLSQLKALQHALTIVRGFEQALIDAELINDF